LVRNVNGTYNAEVTGKVSAIRCTRSAGPEGWREAIEKVLMEIGP